VNSQSTKNDKDDDLDLSLDRNNELGDLIPNENIPPAAVFDRLRNLPQFLDVLEDVGWFRLRHVFDV
jgi:hypothetical protein